MTPRCGTITDPTRRSVAPGCRDDLTPREPRRVRALLSQQTVATVATVRPRDCLGNCHADMQVPEPEYHRSLTWFGASLVLLEREACVSCIRASARHADRSMTPRGGVR